jgi:hypothetical protein
MISWWLEMARLSQTCGAVWTREGVNSLDRNPNVALPAAHATCAFPLETEL